MKYRVYANSTASITIHVEAEDADEALEKALDEGMPTICAQCSGWGHDYSLDLGDDWDDFDVEAVDES